MYSLVLTSFSILILMFQTSPTKNPTVSPTTSPTTSPTVDLPDDGWLVSNILAGSSAEVSGCINTWSSGVNLFDGTTTKFYW